MTARPDPPRFSSRFLRTLLSRDGEVIDDLAQLFQERAARDGLRSARRWYRVQALSFAVRMTCETVARSLARLRPDLPALGVDFSRVIRRLVRRPVYLLSAVVTLGIGVGGLATVYTAANWVLLRPVPGVSEPDRLALVRLESNDANWQSGFAWAISDPDLRAMGDLMPSLASLAASTDDDVNLLPHAGADAVRAPGQVVTANYFDVIGLHPVLGRFFAPADHRSGTGPAEVVVGFDLWHRLWQGRPEALGSSLLVNGRSYTVIGIAPRGFRGAELPGRATIWFPATALPHLRPDEPSNILTIRHQQLWRQVIGRMANGVLIDRVATEANSAMETIRSEVTGGHSFLPDHFVFRAYQGIGLSPYVRATVDRTLGILAAAGVLLLLLAVANIVNLGLARLSSRASEMAIRRALGSGVWRVARDPLLESAALGIAGGWVCIGVAALGVRVFGEASLSARGASLEGMSLDWRVATTCLIVAFLASLVAGAVPALAAARTTGTLRRPQPVSETASTPRFRAALVVTQVALSAVLVVGAGLFARTAIKLQRTDIGFEANGLLSFSIEPGLQGYDDETQRGVLGRVHRRIVADPAVRSLGFIWPKPLRGWIITAAFYPAGGDSREDLTIGAGFDVTPGMLSTIGFEFIAGRDFRASRSALESDSGQVILSESGARSAFPGEEPAATIGRQINQYGGASATIVGVVADARLASVTEDNRPLLFRPINDIGTTEELIGYARINGDPGRGAAVVTGAVGAVAPELPAYDIATGSEQVADLLTEQRVMARLGGVLALTGIFLATVGLYGVLAYGVTERSREIGIRGALGATPHGILTAVVRRGLAMVALGIALGAPAVYWTTRIIESRLYGVSPFDPPTFAAAVLMFLAAGFVASIVPAIRAVKISPVEALRGAD